MAETPVSVWQGEMRLLGVVLHLHVLDDGTRIIEEQGHDRAPGGDGTRRSCR